MNVKRILAPVDFSDYSQNALTEADIMAVNQNAELTLLYVHEITTVSILDFVYMEPPERTSELTRAAEDRLNHWAEQLQTPPERRRVVIGTGNPVSEIIKEGEDHDIIIMATHGRAGLSHFLLGSVAERVVQGAPCSVLIVKDKAVAAAAKK